ncbi:alpha/beta fold hydrolase [Candidatus Methylocalor cossyra]|uniref:Alpha/beta hydrolase n=1 Tax=Candidatus Methylocalor cossyra TaxID=3108543 RepID=A0ABM9NED6_9GAMM
MALPVLFLGNEFTGSQALAAGLDQAAENARIVVVPHSGHWMPEENPAFVAEQLLAFFRCLA